MTATLLQNMAAGIAPPFRPFTVTEYQAMLDAGIFKDGDPIELIDGLIVLKDRRDPRMPEAQMMTHGPAHAAAVRRLLRLLSKIQSDLWHISTQLPLQLGETQFPEPDLAILRGQPDEYDARHPGPVDVLAIFEVSGSSLRYDRTTKLNVYAAVGIPFYGLLNLDDRQIELHTLPHTPSGQYHSRTIALDGESFRLDLPGVEPLEIAVNDVLPSAAPR